MRLGPGCVAVAALLVAARAGAAEPLVVDLGDGVALELARIPKGSFEEGSPKTEPGRGADEDQRAVTLTEDYYLGVDEVTIGQYARFVADSGYKTEAERGSSGGSGWDGHGLSQRKEFTWRHPGYLVTDRHPVTLVTYADATAFTAWLTRKHQRTFALPTEAQWEHAARGGTTTPWPGAKDAGAALALGWFKQNAGDGAHPVGAKAKNPFGLHDMFGNAAEWCSDVHAPYPAGPATDPLASTASGDKLRRVLRGGSWLRDVANGRAASRHANTPGSRNADNGFRVAASVVAAPAPPGPGPASAPPASPLHGPASAPPTSTTGGDEGTTLAALGFALLVFVGAFAIVGFAAYKLVKKDVRQDRGRFGGAGDVRFRLAPDGFWIDAPENLVGSTLRYRVRGDAGLRDGEVNLEGLREGQFVYTGARPLEVTTLGLAAFAAAAPRPVARAYPRQVVSPVRRYVDTTVDDDDGPPSAPSVQPFGGFPSAY